MTSSGNSTAAGQLGAGNPFEQVFPPSCFRLSPGAESSDNDDNDAASEYHEDDLENGTDSEDGEPSPGNYSQELLSNSFGDDDTGYASGSEGDEDELDYDNTGKKIFYNENDVFPADSDSATEFAEQNPDWLEQYLNENPDLIRDYLSHNPKVVQYCFDDNTEPILDILDKNPSLVGIYVERLHASVRSRTGETQFPNHASNSAPVSHFRISPEQFTALQVSHAAERARALNGDGTYPYSLLDLMQSRVHTPGDGHPGWRRYEEDAVVRHMLDIREERKLRGESRFRETADRLDREGITRTWCAVKNYWNRFGRARSGFDERSKKQAPLSTSKQTKAAKQETAQKKQKKENVAQKRKVDEAELDQDTVRAAQNGTRKKKAKTAPEPTKNTTSAVQQEVRQKSNPPQAGKRLPGQQSTPPQTPNSARVSKPASMSAPLPRQTPASLQQTMSRPMQQSMPVPMQGPMSRLMPSTPQQMLGPMLSSLPQQMPHPMPRHLPGSTQHPMSRPMHQLMPGPMQQPISRPVQQPIPRSMQQPMSGPVQRPKRAPAPQPMTTLTPASLAATLPAPISAPTLQHPSPLLPQPHNLESNLFDDLEFLEFGTDTGDDEWFRRYGFDV